MDSSYTIQDQVDILIHELFDYSFKYDIQHGINYTNLEEYYTKKLDQIESLIYNNLNEFSFKYLSNSELSFKDGLTTNTHVRHLISTRLYIIFKNALKKKQEINMETTNRTINYTYPDSVQLIFIFGNSNNIKITRVANITTAKAIADLIGNEKVQALAPFTYEETIIKDREAIIYLESGLSSKHDIVGIILELAGLTQITSNVRG